MPHKPNIIVLLADQLRAASIPLHGEHQIQMPNLDRLAAEGVTFTNAVSTCPVCTPYRAMLLTGRHPQTTGHVVNFMRTRHDEIGLGDVFANAGYATGWVGKWHLHTGCFPQIDGKDFVPEGRDRLGFQYWRGYNFHSIYFNGYVNRGDWRCEQWDGYETEALNRYAFEFLDAHGDEPFCLFLSPHQPHLTGGEFAPARYYDRLPETLALPANVPEHRRESALAAYRHYLAMTLALDDMLGELLDYLDRAGLAEDTLVLFTSDHGTQMGAHDYGPWLKKLPYDESLLVPMVARLPGALEGGGTCDALVSPVDLLPTLCGLCDIPVPRTVEGHDLSDAWMGREDAFEQDAVLTMNFTAAYDYLVDGMEWRGVRTKQHIYTEWLKRTRESSRTRELFDLAVDPLQMHNLAGDPSTADLQATLAARLHALMAARNDALVPCTSYADWFDEQRRVVRNVHGPLSHPDEPPDWSLLT